MHKIESSSRKTGCFAVTPNKCQNGLAIYKAWDTNSFLEHCGLNFYLKNRN